MYVTLENKRKTTTKSPRSVFKSKSRIKEGGALGLRVKKVGEHKSKGLEDEERDNGTICSANINTCKQVEF